MGTPPNPRLEAKRRELVKLRDLRAQVDDRIDALEAQVAREARPTEPRPTTLQTLDPVARVIVLRVLPWRQHHHVISALATQVRPLLDRPSTAVAS